MKSYKFDFRPGNTVYVAHKKNKKVYKFHTDCIKIFAENTVVHGQAYGLQGDFTTPAEFPVSSLFKTEEEAKAYLRIQGEQNMVKKIWKIENGIGHWELTCNNITVTCAH